MSGVEARTSSESLRQEAAALEVRLAELLGKRTAGDEKIRALALSVVRNDSTANGRLSQLKKLREETAAEIALVTDAKVILDDEIKAALDREAAEARAAVAAEARKFADEIAGVGAELDAAITKFRSAYLDLKGKLSRAENGG